MMLVWPENNYMLLKSHVKLLSYYSLKFKVTKALRT